jgi:hypothetical protein
MGVRIAAMLLIASGLGGCTTAAQRQLATINTEASETQKNYKSCIADVAANSEFARILKHVPIDGGPATLEQKADQSFATAQEAKVVLAWRADFGDCRQALNTAEQSFAPTLMPALLEAQNASDSVWVKVVHRELNWGGALQQLADIQTTIREKSQQVGKEMTAELQQEHQAEMAQRHAVASAFAQAAHNFAEQQNQQQMINAINRPRTTDCNGFGYSVSCTSY